MNESKIMAVDFDGTLCFSSWPDLGEPNVPLIEYLKHWKKQGNKLILWTCRAGEALERAITWCKEQEVEFDAVNDNLPVRSPATIILMTARCYLMQSMHSPLVSS